jgi:hypothetical protein
VLLPSVLLLQEPITRHAADTIPTHRASRALVAVIERRASNLACARSNKSARADLSPSADAYSLAERYDDARGSVDKAFAALERGHDLAPRSTAGARHCCRAPIQAIVGPPR